jgi:hypothetical protein
LAEIFTGDESELTTTEGKCKKERRRGKAKGQRKKGKD